MLKIMKARQENSVDWRLAKCDKNCLATTEKFVQYSAVREEISQEKSEKQERPRSAFYPR